MKKLAAIALGVTAFAALVVSAMAASTVVVTPTNTQGWSTADTRPGGAVNFVVDATAPSGVGALQLTTDPSLAAKAQYLHDANLPIARVTELSYATKQNSALFPQGDPSYQFIVDLNGAAAGCFTTFVFEPYENVSQGPVTPGVWQSWDVDAGQMWSSRSFSEGTCNVVAGGGGAPFYTLAGLQAACPNAVVLGFGVNIGSNNPGYNVETDLVNFNGTKYDFEPYAVAHNKDDCKDGGWQTAKRADGSSFKNQGDCVSYTNTGR